MMRSVNAEMLLGYLYPEMEQKWNVRCKGSFYHSYTDDAISFDPESGDVNLSRDGFLKLLPDGVISRKDELVGKGFSRNYESVRQRRSLLEDAFAPLDTFTFRHRLAIERTVSELLDEKLDYVLKTYFDTDRSRIEEPLVRETAAILPFVCGRRGDLKFVRALLSDLLDCPVSFDLSHRSSGAESCSAWLPKVVFRVEKEGLDSVSYAALRRSLDALADFIREWLMPFETDMEIILRDSVSTSALTAGGMLDYNCKMQ